MVINNVSNVSNLNKPTFLLFIIINILLGLYGIWFWSVFFRFFIIFIITVKCKQYNFYQQTKKPIMDTNFDPAEFLEIDFSTVCRLCLCDKQIASVQQTSFKTYTSDDFEIEIDLLKAYECFTKFKVSIIFNLSL